MTCRIKGTGFLMLGARSKNILFYCQISVRTENYHYDHVGYVRKFFVIKTMQMLLSYLNVFRTDYEVLSINYQRVCSHSSWSSGFELVRRVFSYATDRLNIKTPKTLLRWEWIKSGKDFPLKKCLIFQKKIVTILFVVDISLCQGIFPVFLYFLNSFFLITDTSL